MKQIPIPLRFTPIPPGARYPVIVASYRKRLLKEPQVQAAPEIVREFFMTKTIN